VEKNEFLGGGGGVDPSFEPKKGGYQTKGRRITASKERGFKKKLQHLYFHARSQN